MKLDEIMVVEGFSPIVYHATNIERAISILKDDKIYTSRAAISNNSERFSGRIGNYVSFSRSTTGSFTNQVVYSTANDGISAIFEVDGRQLATRFRGEQVEYWRKKNSGTSTLEYEDRLVTDNAWVNNFSKYVKSLTIVINYLYRDDKTKQTFAISDDVARLLLVAVRSAKNIPTYVVSDDEVKTLHRSRVKAAVVINYLRQRGKHDVSFSAFDKNKAKRENEFSHMLSNISKRDELVVGIYYGMLLAIHRNDAKMLLNINKQSNQKLGRSMRIKYILEDILLDRYEVLRFSLSDIVAQASKQQITKLTKLLRAMRLDPLKENEWRATIKQKILKSTELSEAIRTIILEQ